jgi:hypothetical protein
MGGWPRGHRRSADTNEIGFSGPFFTPRREIAVRRQEMERRRQPCVHCRKIRPTAIQSGPFPRQRHLSDPIGGGCRARQAGPGRGADARTQGTRTPVSGCGAGADQRLGSRLHGSQGRRPAFTSHRPPRRKPGTARHLLADKRPLRRRAPPVPTGRAGMQGRRPRRGAPAGALPLVAVAIRDSARPGVSPGLIGAGTYHSPCTSRVPAVDFSGSWPRNGRPAPDLTPPRPGSTDLGPGPGCRPPGPGHCRVRERSAAGMRQVRGRTARDHRRSAPGQWRLAAWATTRPLPVTRSPSCAMTPGSPAQPSGQETASQSRPPCCPAAACSARWIPQTRPSGH